MQIIAFLCNNYKYMQMKFVLLLQEIKVSRCRLAEKLQAGRDIAASLRIKVSFIEIEIRIFNGIVQRV